MKSPSKNAPLIARTLSALAVSLPLLMQAVHAQTTYTYTPTSLTAGSSNTWSSNTGWSPATVSTGSALTTTLVFGGGFNTNGGFTAASTDDIAGAYKVNVLTFTANNSTGFKGTIAYNIAPSSGSNTLELGGTAPTVNLNSLNSASSPVSYNVSINTALDSAVAFTGNGTNAFTFSGVLSDGTGTGSIVKSGTSALTLTGLNTYTGGTTISAGTININKSGTTAANSAIGTGTLTISGGGIDNTSGSTVSLTTTNNAQVWSGDFTWGGTGILNMGTGAVTMSGNRTITANGASALNVGGAISGGGSLSLTGTGTVILSSATGNSYSGGTIVNSGVLVFTNANDIAGSGANVSVASGGTVGFGFALDQTTLGRIAAGSAGAVALGVSGTNSNSLDFSATGVNLPLSLGAVAGTTPTYTGTLTPNGTTYRLGGGGGTLVFNSALAGAGNSLVVGGKGITGALLTGTVTLATAGSYGAGTTVNNGTILQTNLTGTTSPFGSGTVTLNNSTIGFGTATPALTSGQSMDVSLGALTFNGGGTVQLAKGASTQTVPVKVTIASLNQGAQGGVLFLKPSAGANLGVTEQVVVTSGTGTVPLTVTNGMVSPNIIDITSNNFVTYGANGFTDAAATAAIYGANNIVSDNLNFAGTKSAYAYIWNNGGGFTSTINIGSGGFIVIGTGQNSTGNINFGSAPGYVYFTSQANNNGMHFTGTGGITYSGGGLINVAATSLGMTGGITFANGAFQNGNGSEPYATLNPNSLTILNGASFGPSAGTIGETFSSLAGDGGLNSGNGLTMNVSLNGLATTNNTTFSGNIVTSGTGVLNIIKNGTSVQTLTGVNNYSGTTTIRNGAIVLSGLGTLGSGTLTLSAGGTLSMDNGATNVSNRLSGITTVNLGGNLNLIGNAAGATTQTTGTLNLGTGPGVVTLTAGTGQSDQLTFAALGTRAAGSTSLFRGTGLTGSFSGAANTSNIVFTTAPTSAATGSFTSSGTGTGTQMAVIRGGLFDATATGGGSGFATVDATTKSVRLLDSATEQTTTYGTANTNALINLTAATGITGAATNTLQVNNVSSTAWTLTNTGSALNPANGLLFTGTDAITLTGGTYTGANATDLVVLSTNTSGVTIGTAISNTTSGGGLTFGGSGNLTLNGALGLVTGGAGAIYFDNSGTTTIGSTVATGSGGIQILNGTVKMGGTGLSAFNKALAVAPNATFDLNNNAVSVDAFNSVNAASATTNFAGGGTVTNSGGTATNFTVGASGAGGTYNGLIASAIKLIKAGAGVEILTGANTYTGTTTITGGTLSVTQLGNGGAASGIGQASNAAANLLIGAGTTFSYVGAGDSTDRLFTMSGATATLDASGYNTGGGLSGKINYTNTGAIAFGTANSAETLTLGGSNTQANSLAALLGNNGTGALGVTKSGAGTWILSNANTYTGVTSVGQGLLGVTTLANGGSASAIGQSTNAATNLLIGGGGTVQTAGLQYTGSTNSSTDRLFTINGSVANIVATLDASGSGSVSFTNTGNLGYGTTNQTRGLILTGTSTAANSFAPTLANNGTGVTSLTKTGVGTWTVSGSSTFTGGTTLSAGTLVAGASTTVSGGAITNGPFGTGTIAMASGSTLADNGTAITLANSITTTGTVGFGSTGTGSLTLDGTTLTVPSTVVMSAATTFLANNTTTIKDVVSGAFALTQSGTGTLALNAANTYTGVTTVTSGILSTNLLAAGGSASGIGQSTNAAANLVLNGGTLQYTGSSNVTTDRLFTLGGTVAGATGTIDSSGTGTLSFGSGALAYGTAAQTRTLILTGTNTGANTFGLTLANNTTGATSLTKNGTGTWVMTAANTYTGVTTLNAGVLNLGSAEIAGTSGPLGKSAASNVGSIVLNGGILQYSAANANDYSGRFSNASNQQYNIDTNGRNVTFGTDLISTNGTFTLNDTATTPGTLTFNGAMYAFYDGPTTVTRGELDLNNYAVYSNVVVNGGTVKLLRNNVLTNGSNLAVSSGTFNLNGFNQTGSVFDPGGNFPVGTLAGVQLTGGQIIGAGTLTSATDFDIQGGSASAILDGAVGLNKTGTGTATLSGANTFTGPVTISNGTLAVTSLASVGTAQALGKGSTVTLNGATSSAPGVLAYTSNAAATLAQNVTVTTGAFGTISNTGSGLLTVAGAISKDGSVLNLSGGVAGGQIKVTGTISGASANSDLNAINNSHVILAANNSYTGPTTIDNTSSIQVGDSGTTGTLGNGNVTNNGVLSYKRTNAITESNAISGTGSLSQIGTGTTTLTSANTYSGGTTVSAGKLLVDNTTGSGTGSGAVTVSSGATLGGTGTIGGSTTLSSGSILAPGNTAGTLTVNSGLTLNNNTAGSLLFDLGSISDKVVVGGTLTLNGQDFTSFTFDTSGGGFGAGTYVLFDASSAIAGTLGSNLTSTQFTGYNATLSLDSINNDFILTVAVVPEPGTWAMMVGGLVLLVVIHRRRNSSV